MPTPPSKSPTTPVSSAGPARQKQLLALGSAAVLTVYATGFLRTKAAADALDEGSNARRRPPAPSSASAESAPARAATAPVASSPSNPTTVGAPAATSVPVPPTDDSARFTVVVKKGVAQVVAKSATPDSAGRLAAAVAQTTAATASDSGTSVTKPAAVTPTTPVPAPAPVSSPEPVPTTAAAAPTAPPAEAPKPVGWRDGTYTGWGTSRHGDIEATVVIEGGKITGAIISRCLTRYSCSWVAHLQQQVVARQSPEVDNVSGATQSANAFFYAVSEALAKAK